MILSNRNKDATKFLELEVNINFKVKGGVRVNF